MNIIKFIKGALIALVLIVISTGVAKAVTDGLPQISVVCEDKHGLLFSLKDGFSIFKKCPKNTREVILVGQPGPKGEKGDPGQSGLKGDKGDPGESGFISDKTVHVCFHVPNGSLRVLQAADCGSDVHWQIPVNCVDGKPCKPDNQNDLYYLNNN